MLNHIEKIINIVSKYFSTLFLCSTTVFLVLIAYFFSYIFIVLVAVSATVWIFRAIINKEKRQTSLIRLGMYVLVFCIFYGYGQYLKMNQIAARNEVANVIQNYEREYGIYPSREFVQALTEKYSKYQMRFFYYLLPITPKKEEPVEIEGYTLFYKTSLLGIYDNVFYREDNEWEIVYD